VGDGFGITIVSILFAAFGIVMGFHFGEEAGYRLEGKGAYAAANLAAVVIGGFLFMIVFATGYVVVGMFAIGAVAGAVAGLKFGFGESVGPWKFVDKLMTPAARERDRDRARVKRAEIKREATGEAEPELMSVKGEAKKDK
jgi:hypothetical protein